MTLYTYKNLLFGFKYRVNYSTSFIALSESVTNIFYLKDASKPESTPLDNLDNIFIKGCGFHILITSYQIQFHFFISKTFLSKQCNYKIKHFRTSVYRNFFSYSDILINAPKFCRVYSKTLYFRIVF